MHWAINAWLVDLKSGNEDSGDDQDETAQSREESSWSRKAEDGPTTHDGRKKRRGQGNPIARDNLKHAPRDVALKANPGAQSGSEPTASKSAIGTTIMTLPGLASAEGSLIQKELT